MAKRKIIARIFKDIDNGAQVFTGHRAVYFLRMGWDLYGKKKVQELLQGGIMSGPAAEAEDWRYQALKIKPDSSNQVLKLAWKLRSWETHPDHGGDEEESKRVNRAYSEICKERGINP